MSHITIPAPVVLTALLLCASATIPLRAQPGEPIPEGAERIIDDALEHSDEESSDDLDLLDELEEYAEHPIDLATAPPAMVARLPGISIQEAREIIEFVDRVGPRRVYDLDALPWLTEDQLRTLLVYTRIRRPREADSTARLRVEIRSRMTLDLRKRRGYGDTIYHLIPRFDAAGDSVGIDTVPRGSSYLGSRPGYLERIAISWGRFSGGLTFEKDPGEPLFHDDTMGLGYERYAYLDPRTPPGNIERRLGSFLSGHAAARLGPVTLYAGDYSLQLGQGLLFGGSFGGFKGGDVTASPFTSARGLAPYRSAGEYGFYRGAALELHDGEWLPRGLSARAFVSSRSLDASLGGDPEEPETVVVTGLREDGYRRTRSELRRSGNLTERLAGININGSFRGGSIGMTAYHATYDIPFTPRLPYDFAGGALTMVSIDGGYAIGRSTLFGELARGSDGTLAATGGIIATISRLEMTVAGRYLPARFQSPHGRGFGEAPLRQHNEQGLYCAVSAPILPELHLDAFIDLYHIPERTATVPFPRSGVDGYLQLDYTPSRRFSLRARLRREITGDAATIADEAGIDRRRLIDLTTITGRIEAEYLSPGERMRLRARFERRFAGYSRGEPSRNGVLTFVDLRWRPSPMFSVGARGVLFDTDDFDAAIREFEQDLPGRTTTLALAGEGRRFYCYAQWRPLPALSLAVKYGETVYADRARISPGGTQEIAGPVASTIGLQADIRFR